MNEPRKPDAGEPKNNLPFAFWVLSLPVLFLVVILLLDWWTSTFPNDHIGGF